MHQRAEQVKLRLQGGPQKILNPGIAELTPGQQRHFALFNAQMVMELVKAYLECEPRVSPGFPPEPGTRISRFRVSPRPANCCSALFAHI